jgi:signal transduction histidine kinase
VADRTEQLRREATDRLQLEAELRHAQKLEAVGRLASGVAHEINTPIQFIGDGVHFVQEASTGLIAMIEAAQNLARAVEAGEATADAVRALRRAEKEADLEFLVEELPAALERTQQGVGRVAEIVRAMRGFARLEADRIHADLNSGLRDTLTVSRNEYKLVADVETDFGDLPRVLCHAGDLNQVFLNLIVNAAHAIEDRVSGSSERGTIRVATRTTGDKVVVEIGDDGTGIPEDVRERIFDPFFTTKKVGRGTGQGLAISRSIVVDNHGGSIDCDSVVGEGTTFRITLPAEAA